ncbi:MAG: hypothetical protein EA376_04815 [Phycisphaeraceae bacterium]|nr:MAG: hypothetical protein EA376_04815 [Phycisphaeraceae bacterium]
MCACSLLLFSGVARAGSVNVANGDTAGLIAAINTVLSDAELDTINLAPDGAYVLTEVDNTFSGANGLPQIYSTLTINGNGAEIRRSGAMGTPEFRFFFITALGDLTLNDLTLVNGLQSVGGAIRNDGGALSVNDCVFEDNTADPAPGTGGAIHASNDAVTAITGSSFTGNTGTGGAVFNSNSTATIEDCDFIQNTGSAGGAIVHLGDNGVMHIIDSVISYNESTAFAGGVFSSGVLNMTGCVISGNFAPSSGAGIRNNGGTMTIIESEITGNTGESAGGGIFSSDGLLTIENSLIADNAVIGASGGGIWNRGELTITDTEIRENHAIATVSKSGLYSGGAGGGVFLEGGQAHIERCRFIENTAVTSGGGIQSLSGPVVAGELTLIDSTFDGNVSTDFPGGGLFSNATLTMSGCTFTNNFAASGGAYSNGVSGSAVVTNCTFSGNTAMTSGGGVAISSQAGVTLRNCTIVGNSGGQNGAGLFAAFNSVLTITNSIVAGSTGGIDASGPFTDGGHNIFADGFNISHLDSMDGDPMLGPLADNGGPTMTHALLKGSIAIDAGDCADGEVDVDQRGVSRPQGMGCDIGAYEREVDGVPGDVNGDGVVNAQDLGILLGSWGFCPEPPASCPADINGDGVVNAQDLGILLGNWGGGG